MKACLAAALLPLLLQGCVMGYGPCMITGPVKHTFTGKVQYKQYPDPGGIDTVPVLLLDRTEYVYLPAQSTRCLAANDVQLSGLAQLPRDVVEGTHVVVEGKIFAATGAHEHTPLLIAVTTVLPLHDRAKEKEAPDGQ